MKSSGKILFTFIGGAAAGTIAGLLFAPKSGKKNRKSLSKRAHNIKKNLEDSIGETISRIKDYTID